MQLERRAFRETPDARPVLGWAFRCEHCTRWFRQPADKPPQRYCTPEHRAAGARRRRLGLVPDFEPGATPDRLQQVAAQLREAKAGARSWSDVGADS